MPPPRRQRVVPRTILGTLLAHVVIVVLVAPPSASALVGSPVVGTAVDWNTAGYAQAYRVQSTETEQVDSLNVFIDASSSLSSGSRLALGLYSSYADQPQERLGHCTITAPVGGEWNRCTFSPTWVTSGAPYWIAALQPVYTPGTVKFRDAPGVGASYGSPSGILTSPPSPWVPGSSWGPHRASIYASASSEPAPAPTPPAETPAAPPVDERPANSCDVEVSSRASLLAALQTLANGGRTICAHAADYGTTDLRISVRHTTMTRLMANPGERVRLPVVVLAGVSNLRIQGFDMPNGGFDTGQQSARDIELIGNEIHDCACQALRLWRGDVNILFQGNYVHNIRFDGRWGTGWGINATGHVSGLKVRYNTFDGLGNDAMEIADSDDGEIVGNVIKHVDGNPAYADSHPDSIMLWAGSQRWLIKDNRITDGRGILMSGSTTDVRMENNLVARIKNWCQDGGTTGSSWEGLIRYTWIRNTMYDCGRVWWSGGFGGTYGLLSDGPAYGNTLKGNLLASIGLDSVSQFLSADHNLVNHGAGIGSTDRAFTPQFADQIDYRPTNLPAGYEDVGYRAAPAGHLAAP